MTHSGADVGLDPHPEIPETVDAIAPAEIHVQLKRLVESPFFKSSKRCRLFLECVIEHSLGETPEPLKERTLGVQVFGRQPTYDTGTDPIVRVTAGEVRRRLGQYYGEEAHHAELRVDVPPGSYAPMYSRPHPFAAPPPPPPPPAQPDATPRIGHTMSWRLAAGLAVVIGVGSMVVLATRDRVEQTTTFDRFWGPFWQAQGPVLVCAGGLDMYELPWDLKRAAEAAASSLHQPPPVQISPRDVQRVGARYVAIADAVAIARIAALFQERRRPYLIREHHVTSFADLRASPAVLIGMFSNSWNLQLGSGFRFVPTIEGDGQFVSIIDRQAPDKSWRLARPWPSLKVTHDYALISRVIDQATGTPVISAGGITPFGTSAAGEFLTSPELTDRALRNVRDWEKRSLQIVLETQVIDGAAGAPRVLATHVW
jgi:hypothetical protein